MFGWSRIFTLAAVAAAVAIVAGGAGAASTSTFAGRAEATPTSTLAAATVSHAATTRKVSAASRRGMLLKGANLSTRAGVARYLRAIGLDPRGFVIQRGARNYAGPSCPGAGWACTSTAHPVVQIAAAGGKNTFLCSTGSCAVVQTTAALAAKTPTSVAAAAAPPNKATCIKTSGLGQSCSISQTGGGTAIVYENSGKTIGLTQTASQTASITQRATGTNTNVACVTQAVNIDGSTNLSGKKGAPINVALEAHQTITISQTSDANGSNTAVNGATASGTCDLNSTSPTYVLNQAQTLSSTVTGTGSITQNENAANSGPNMTLDITQNQNAGTGTFGPNTATFNQTNSLSAIANGQGTVSLPISQTQSSLNGGILAAVNQSGPGVSTATATQNETQCEDAATSGLLTCSTTEHSNPGLASLAQTQHGPVRKTPGDSSQTGNTSDTFTVTQSSRQDSDSGSTQSNVVEGGFSTSGSGTVTQTTNENGQQTQSTQSGQNVDSSINCPSGSSCTATAPPTPIIDSGPDVSTTSTDATFTFHDADPTATFLCQLDNGGYSSCTTGKSYTGLSAGAHTFYVKATDQYGNASAPATYGWTITMANTDLMTNGSFEADPFDYNGTFDLGSSNPLTGWTTSTSGLYPWGLPYPNVFNAGPTPYGNQWVIVGNQCDQGTSWIEQTINTTVGQAYTLSFALASEEGGSGAQVVVSFPTGSSTTSQTFTAPPSVATFWDTWATSSMDFTATGTSATIRFTSVPLSVSEGCDAGIDNVVVTAAQTIG